tara:strand:+ start:1279 stop:1536 length:258 start_codon:yes stop_codon:yes gene_type:complete
MAYSQSPLLKKVGTTKDDEKPGSSNAGKYDSSEGPFCGPSGGAAKGTYPVGSIERGRAALSYSKNAPNPMGIKSCVYKKWPTLKK